MSVEPALAVEAVSVRFGGVVALDTVSVAVAPGSVHGIIGPNGSGKTTLINALCGLVRCTGSMRLFGHSLDRLPPHRRIASGLGRTFQNPKVGDDLSVRDLLRVGEYQLASRPFWQEAFAPWRVITEERRFADRMIALLGELEIDLPSLDAPAASLSHGMVKMLDLARALMGRPKVILLDESTSGLSEGEIKVMREQLHRLRCRDQTIVVVEHNVRFLSDVCDQVTVLDAGRRIAGGTLASVFEMPEVIQAYMGQQL